MMISQNRVVVSMPLMPLFLHRVTIRPAGPTANTVPTMISSTTENTRMMFCITGPRYLPVTSAMEAPSLRSLIIPEK